MNEKKNRDCATSFPEIYVHLYDFEKYFVDKRNKSGLNFVI